MNVCGIVVEYNPFHNGHIHHIHQARKQSGCDLLIAVMSPHFVQRGEPAIADKWSRARTALHHGVDLVRELPTSRAVQSAQFFASAAIDILALAGADTIAFGSESNDLDPVAYTHQWEKCYGPDFTDQDDDSAGSGTERMLSV